MDVAKLGSLKQQMSPQTKLFNWNIIKAPHSIVDYVVIHELCHLVHPNHSKDFWQLVGRFDTDYPEHRQWLKEQGVGLL